MKLYILWIKYHSFLRQNYEILRICAKKITESFGFMFFFTIFVAVKPKNYDTA